MLKVLLIIYDLIIYDMVQLTLMHERYREGNAVEKSQKIGHRLVFIDACGLYIGGFFGP